MKLVRNSAFAACSLVVSSLSVLLLLSAFSQVGFAQPVATAQAPEEVIVRAPEIVRRLPRTGPDAPAGLTNPEIISLTRPVSYSDLDLSRPADVAELRARVRKTAREICQDLNRRYPRANNQYVYANVDCVKTATDEGLVTVRLVSAVARR